MNAENAHQLVESLGRMIDQTIIEARKVDDLASFYGLVGSVTQTICETELKTTGRCDLAVHFVHMLNTNVMLCMARAEENGEAITLHGLRDAWINELTRDMQTMRESLPEESEQCDCEACRAIGEIRGALDIQAVEIDPSDFPDLLMDFAALKAGDISPSDLVSRIKARQQKPETTH